MRLNFKPYEFGFTLENSIPSEELQEDRFVDVSPHIEFLVTKEGEVAFVDWPFLKDPLQELEVEVTFLKKNLIPGRYDVPELGLKDATFVEVLEAIRDYYARKFGKKSETPAAA